MNGAPPPSRRWAHRVAFQLALAAFAISFAALMGYGLEKSGLTRWGGGVEMALNTSLAITFLSLAVLALLLRSRND